MIIGFDADQDCSRVAPLAFQNGVQFICRYYKNLTLAEAKVISATGLKIVSIWETTAERSLSGAAGGTADGNAAMDAAAALGQPQGSAIYLTCDFGETADQDATVRAYCDAFKAAMRGEGRLGVYAEGALCQTMLDAKVADLTWLAGGMGMRGTRAFAQSGRATLMQDVGDRRNLRLGIDIDSDIATVGDYGGWRLAA